MKHEDFLDIEDLRNIRGDETSASKAKGPEKKFLSVWYKCCHTYGRLNRNKAGTQYVGRCPRCGNQVQATIGPGGTSQHMFTAE